MAWPDLDLHNLVVSGVKPVGAQERIGIYRSKVTTPSLALEDLVKMNPEFRKQVRNRPPPPPDQAKAIFQKSVEEQLDGILSPWLSEDDLDKMFGAGDWYGIFRFALWQKEKYRMIDDASQGQNQTISSGERIHTTSAAAAAAVTRKFRQEYGKKLRGGQADARVKPRYEIGI